MVNSIKRLEKQLTYLGVLGDLWESNSLRSPLQCGTSCDDCQHQFMVVACPSLNILGKISASWDWISSAAAALPKISSFVDAHFVSHLGRHECPRLTLSLLFPCQQVPFPPHLSSSTSQEEVRTLAQLLDRRRNQSPSVLWPDLYYCGFYCIVMGFAV